MNHRLSAAGRLRMAGGLLAGWLLAGLPAMAATVEAPAGADLFAGWRTYTVAQGLPSNKVMAVAVDGRQAWAGTENGLALIREGVARQVDRPGDLPFPAITALALNDHTGDLWIGTLGGLARFNGGRFQSYTQMDSGLANDVIYGVAVNDQAVWVATAAGLSKLDLASGAWSIYDTSNTLMHEPWCYAVTLSRDKVYTAVWGSGLLVHDTTTGSFKVHRDPDHEMEIDLFRDDGLIHDVTSAVASSQDILWVGTYFGLSRYQGRRWRSWYADDSGLAGDFINALEAAGEAVWIATDQGLSRLQPPRWHTWRRNEPMDRFELALAVDGADGERVLIRPAGPPSNTIFGIDVDEEGVWLATDAGLAHGLFHPDALATPGPSQDHPQGGKP